VTLAGCAPAPVACPAVGWINSVVVHVEGSGAEEASVQVCDGDHCSSVAGAEPPSTGVPMIATRQDDGSWKVGIGMATPSPLTVRALDATGAVLAEQDAELAWHRTGGSAQCGGPSSAEPVTLRLP
jgi:hypothetical protein